MRRIWAIVAFLPSQTDLDNAALAGAAEIVSLPCPALPQLTQGYNEVAEYGDAPAEQVEIAVARLRAEREAALGRFNTVVCGIQHAIPLTHQTTLDLLVARHQLAKAPAGATIAWEVSDDVWIDASLADVEHLIDAGHAWTQACYATSKALMAQIKASAAPLAVDLTAGWPG